MVAAASIASSKERVKLPFLDGVRGFAALYVVLCHLWLQQKMDFGKLGWGISPFWQHYMATLTYQTDAVGVFIVLSGFLLMLPCVRDGKLPGGFWAFAGRRFRRIVPAYYAALVLGLALIALKSRMGSPEEMRSLTAGNLIAHVLLAHNAKPEWMISIDPPMWSVAIEWQIYFIFAWALLPIYRRGGLPAALIAACLLGLAPAVFHIADWSDPWYITLFGFGMAGAVIVTSDKARLAGVRDRVPWGLLCAVLAFVAYGIIGYAFRQHLQGPWKTVLVGSVAATFLIHCARQDRKGRKTAALRVLDSRFARWLATISYSLYLTHDLIISHVWLITRKIHNAGIYAAALWVIGLAGSLAFAHVFAMAFERPFMTKKSKDMR